MPDLEMSLTYEERIKLFQDRLYKVIKTVGKKKGSPGQLKLSELLPDKDENTTRQIAELLGKLAKNGRSKWKDALLSAQISIIRTRSVSYEISFQYHVVPAIELVDCVTVLIETAENNVVDNGVMEVDNSTLIEVASSEDNSIFNESQVSALTDNSNNATMEEEEVRRHLQRNLIH